MQNLKPKEVLVKAKLNLTLYATGSSPRDGIRKGIFSRRKSLSIGGE